MTTKTQVETKPALTADWDRVTVTGLQEGEPALLGFYSALTLHNGVQKRCGQVVRVTDERLLQRLRAEVSPGDEIRVCIEIDKTVPDCPTVLKDFCPV